MPNIHEEAFRGSLTPARLRTHLSGNASPRSVLDVPGGPHSVTPLAAACWQGHLDTVHLLLDNPYQSADPNAHSVHKRTALFYAITHSPPKDRAAIVRALLDKGADVDACSADDGYNTPLMNAIALSHDKAVVHELVDHGASLTMKNKLGMTAEMLAKAYCMERDVLPLDQRNSMGLELTNFITAFVLLVIAVVNSGMLKDIARKVLCQLCECVRGTQDQNRVQDCQDLEPTEEEEVADNLGIYIEETGLESFFPPNDDFVQGVARKAAALRNDPTTDLGTPENIKRLTVLSLYRLVIYCDDSGSMSYNHRFERQCELVARIARVATKIVPDDCGVDLHFINAESASNLPAAEIENAMKAVSPDGGTPIGTSLRQRILEPLVYSVLDDPRRRLERPLLICTVTDGAPTDGDMFRNEIINCRKRVTEAGYSPTSVMFCISQIGEEQQAADFLEGLRGDPDIQDMLYCTTDQLDRKFKELRENERKLEGWLLDFLTKPLVERVVGRYMTPELIAGPSTT